MLYFLKIRLYLHTETDYLTKKQFKAKKKGFRTLKMLYFLKIRLYLHTETDYLTK